MPKAKSPTSTMGTRMRRRINMMKVTMRWPLMNRIAWCSTAIGFMMGSSLILNLPREIIWSKRFHYQLKPMKDIRMPNFHKIKLSKEITAINKPKDPPTNTHVPLTPQTTLNPPETSNNPSPTKINPNKTKKHNITKKPPN
jgi:hypothetical protein